MSEKRRSSRVAAAVKPQTPLPTYDSNLNGKFSLSEKQLLLEALKRYPVDCLLQIQKEYLPKRKTAEIDLFIKRMKNNAKERYLRDIDIPHQAPIERWLQTAEDLTYHDFDYSYTLSQVMSIAGNLEPHDAKWGVQHPDWPKLYRYIVALLRGDHPPQLEPVEAAVMLDLIQSLADQLKQMETSAQRELMIRKFRLLTANVDINNKEASYAAARRALEEDLLDPSTAELTADSLLVQTPRPPKKRGRKRKGEAQAVDPRPAKTSLYSINPFCIPVKYLKLRAKTSSNSPAQTPVSSGPSALSSPPVGDIEYSSPLVASPGPAPASQTATPVVKKMALPAHRKAVLPVQRPLPQHRLTRPVVPLSVPFRPSFLQPVHPRPTLSASSHTRLSVPQRGTVRSNVPHGRHVLPLQAQAVPQRHHSAQPVSQHRQTTTKPPPPPSRPPTCVRPAHPGTPVVQNIVKKSSDPQQASHQKTVVGQTRPMQSVYVRKPVSQSYRTMSDSEPVTTTDRGNVTRKIIITENPSGTTTINIPTNF